ncbi:MAG TPA: hypothetical protein VF538_18165 [Pyrinomonadaceae bacterium]|jgi:hypothetical protein
MKIKRAHLFASIIFLTLSALMFGTHASADTTVVVTQTNTQGWSTEDTRPGGAVDFVTDMTAPGGTGALQLTTDATTTSKAQYLHGTNTALSGVTNLSYYTKQISASFVGGDPSYQLALCLNGFALNGDCLGFTTMVFEPYQNGTVTPGIWQSWDVDAGQFWSSRSASFGACTVVAGFGGAPFYSLSQLKANCPNAVAVAFGVNIGSNNPSYNVFTDLVRFNDTVYDFEVFSAPANKDQCKNGGWATFNPNRPAGPFKNQGDCVSFASNGK